ncbi:MAG: hypothetical protein BWY28_01599 [bacterium ADurb.Bin236]|nr:MAG: hypothetical protein BWY28_01599 [bacterium ADurb.Bin236]
MNKTTHHLLLCTSLIVIINYLYSIYSIACAQNINKPYDDSKLSSDYGPRKGIWGKGIWGNLGSGRDY